MRLQYEELPTELQKQYKPRDIHKAVKKTSTLIQVHTKDKSKDNWWKHGQQWSRDE